MRQYFYLVAHTVVGDDLAVDKIFLQEHDAVRWGRTLATKNPDYSVGLYRQEISRTAVLGYAKGLTPFKPQKGADSDIDHDIEGNRIPEEPLFYWDAYLGGTV